MTFQTYERIEAILGWAIFIALLIWVVSYAI